MKKFQYFLFTLLLITFSQNLFAQDSLSVEDERKRGRNLHVSTGAFSSINYDQKLIGARNVDHSLSAGIQINMLTDFGLLNFNFDRIFSANLHVIGLLGKNRSFAELGLGYGVGFGTGRPKIRLDTISRIFAGYRFKFDKGLLRVGIGVPEILYVGGGIRF